MTVVDTQIQRRLEDTFVIYQPEGGICQAKAKANNMIDAINSVYTPLDRNSDDTY